MTILRIARGGRWRMPDGTLAEAPDHGYLVTDGDGRRIFLPAEAVVQAPLARTCASCHLVGCDGEHPRSCSCGCGVDHRATSPCPHLHGTHPDGESRICTCNCRTCLPPEARPS